MWERYKEKLEKVTQWFVLFTTCHWSKSKAVPFCDMAVYRGTRGITPLILNLNARCRWVVNFMSHSLYGKEKSRYFVNRWLVSTIEGLGILENRKSLVPVQIWTLDCPVHSIVTTLTMWHQSHWILTLPLFLITFFFQVNRASWSYAETSLCCHLPGRVGHKWEETAWSCIPASTVGQSRVVQSSRLCCRYNKRCGQVILVKLSLLYTQNHWLLGWQVEPVILCVNSFKSFFLEFSDSSVVWWIPPGSEDVNCGSGSSIISLAVYYHLMYFQISVVWNLSRVKNLYL